jgi:hypothetical protein
MTAFIISALGGRQLALNYKHGCLPPINYEVGSNSCKTSAAVPAGFEAKLRIRTHTSATECSAQLAYCRRLF